MYTVKIGFVPSYRFRYTPWAQKMRDDSLATFAQVEGMQVVVPGVLPEGQPLDEEKGQTPHGMVHSLDEAEMVAEYFRRQKVDGLILCPLDFGDERSAAKVAEKLQVPVLLYATKEPPGVEGPSLGRVSDSYCGNLSMASGLYRRKIPFRYAGLFFPGEDEFKAEVQEFVRAVAVVAGLRGARIGQVGVRPPTFETVGYDEAAMIQTFGHNVIYANLSDITSQAQGYPDDDPRVLEIIADMRASVAEITVADDYVLNAAKLERALRKAGAGPQIVGHYDSLAAAVQHARQLADADGGVAGAAQRLQVLVAEAQPGDVASGDQQLLGGVEVVTRQQARGMLGCDDHERLVRRGTDGRRRRGWRRLGRRREPGPKAPSGHRHDRGPVRRRAPEEGGRPAGAGWRRTENSH